MGVRCYEVYDVRIVPFGARLCRYCFIPGGAFFAEVLLFAACTWSNFRRALVICMVAFVFWYNALWWRCRVSQTLLWGCCSWDTNKYNEI
jgi:hypothetical protein